METFREFLDRINSFEKKVITFDNENFKCNPSLMQKVDKNNAFRNFYGDTVVFTIDDAIKNKLCEYVNLLYQVVPECFCERLAPNTFHVTLHDLSNSPILHNVAEELFYNEIKIIEVTNKLSKLKNINIKMQSTYIFNMVNTSLVLGLFPATEADYCRLMELYFLFDGVKKLSYPLTPHITLAYYNINGFDLHSAELLASAVNKLNNEIELKINVSKLFYQKFRSMNDYIDIVNLTKF